MRLLTALLGLMMALPVHADHHQGTNPPSQEDHQPAQEMKKKKHVKKKKIKQPRPS